jgi:histidinol-phosphate/aromatic aminotransferase/cobyric acid decarboxylase-like protein/GTP:adenosylcobinamide-phosphate guanylyltransferase
MQRLEAISMQGLILAAGLGARLGSLTADRTKGMLSLHGRTLIERAIDGFRRAGIRRVVVVIGHAGNDLSKYLQESCPDIEFVFVTNPIYDKTNNIYSLWLAREQLLADDTVVLESDLVFDRDLVKRVVEDPEANVAVVAPFEAWMDGTVTLLDGDGRLTAMVPKELFDWERAGDYYKTVNVYKFSREFSERVYMPFLDAYIKAFGRNRYYETVLAVITYIGEHGLAGHVLDREWYEIDDLQDLDIAEALFAEGREKLERMQRRYGGYWRFPKLLDYCYLVNPYFPSPRLSEELEANFDRVLREYPSGRDVVDLLAAKTFQCDPEQITVGNGASELIRGHLRDFEGRFGIMMPTFNEYFESAARAEIVKHEPTNPDFTYTLTDLKALADRVDSLLLINPDNPSGHYVSPEDVLALLEHLEEQGKRLILDESFVDFVDRPDGSSFLSGELLAEHPGLVVIKSISKSYGVPGARLGVLASGDTDLVARAKRDMPIWNINSIGEYFLQVIGKYKSDYRLGCDALRRERARFGALLREIPFLRVIPSQSNYFLCEVTERYASIELAERLLDDHDILIKDCTGKPGFGNGQFVRLSVRDRDDDDRMMAALRALASS